MVIPSAKSLFTSSSLPDAPAPCRMPLSRGEGATEVNLEMDEPGSDQLFLTVGRPWRGPFCRDPDSKTAQAPAAAGPHTSIPVSQPGFLSGGRGDRRWCSSGCGWQQCHSFGGGHHCQCRLCCHGDAVVVGVLVLVVVLVTGVEGTLWVS